MKSTLAVGIGALALVVSMTPTATAGDDVVADNLTSPLGFVVAGDGTIYVAEAFAGMLTEIAPDGTRTEIASAPPGSGTSGVARNHNGGIYYTLTLPPEVGSPPDTALGLVRPDGSTKILASMSDYEAANNPDADNVYGLLNQGACWDALSRFPKKVGPPQYTGQIESNPYAVANEGYGSVLVADAAGNDILRVDHGDVSTVAVLPPINQKLDKPTVRALMRQINRQRERHDKEPIPRTFFDSCIGEKYASNPVPTDVEIGRDGDFYVSTLPGFPELPGYARVFRIDSDTGDLRTVARGLTGATDLAVARDGTIYVSELFAYQVSMIEPGEHTASSSIPIECPTAVEIGPRGRVYVAHNGLCTDTPGEIIRLPR